MTERIRFTRGGRCAELTARAFRRSPQFHALLHVYNQIVLDAIDGADFRTYEQIGEQLGLSERHIRGSVAILKKLGLVRALRRGQYETTYAVPIEADRWMAKVLGQIEAGTVAVAVNRGTVTHVPTGVELDWSASRAALQCRSDEIQSGTPVPVCASERHSSAGLNPERHSSAGLNQSGPHPVNPVSAESYAVLVGPDGAAAGQGEFFSHICSSINREIDKNYTYMQEKVAEPEQPTEQPTETPPAPKKKGGRPKFSRETDPHREEIERWWAAYLAEFKFPRARQLNDDRYKAIREAHVKLGYEWADLHAYIPLAAAVPFFRGENAQNTAYDEPGQILRTKHIDKYLDMAERGQSPRSGGKPDNRYLGSSVLNRDKITDGVLF